MGAADGGVCINSDELLKGRVGQNSDIDSSASSCMDGELSLQKLNDLSVVQLVGKRSMLKSTASVSTQILQIHLFLSHYLS